MPNRLPRSAAPDVATDLSLRRHATVVSVMQSVDRTVGERIRLLRKQRGLSLEQVASAAGLSIGFLSQIERGLSSPTLRALTSLADVTGVGIADLLQPAPAAVGNEPVITRRGRRPNVVMWKSGIRKALLAGGRADSSSPFAFTVLEFRRGASSGPEHYRHEGEEAGVVIEGRLRLSFADGASWMLGPGDSFHFNSDLPHRFENAAESRTSVVMVNVNACARPRPCAGSMP